MSATPNLADFNVDEQMDSRDGETVKLSAFSESRVQSGDDESGVGCLKCE